MPLTPGTRLGAYEVSAPIGAGGMGEVYRARDTRLGRFVAVKVLPADVASDPNRRKRLEREARAVAALCHPHICTVFDVGREETPSGPCDYLVMELLEGESLAERLRRGPLPIDQLLKAGIELASALYGAHRAGVVHRDVKPGNMVLTKTGAKLLDFGLARLLPVGTPADAEGAGVTETLDPLTNAGQAMGTYPYMAPEQLEGQSVDARADLFALGAVLYEMATGQRAFPGTSPSSIVAAILTTDPPPIGSLRSVLPRSLDRLVRTLLAKDPDERVQSAHDVVLRLREIAEDSGGAQPAAAQGARQAGELQEIKEGSDSGAVASAAPTGRNRRRWLGAAVMGALILAAGAVAVAIAGRQWRGRVADTARRSSTSAIRVEKLTNRGNASNPAISPDGRYLAYTSREGGRSEIWLRDVGERTETRLVGPIDTEDPSFGPRSTIRFAKDGQAVCFELTPKGSGRPHLYRVPFIGGDPRLIRADARIDQLSPDLKLLAFSRRQDAKTVLVIADAESGQEKEVGEVARVLAWSPDGSRLLFSRVKHGTHILFLVGADANGGEKAR